MEIVDKTAVNDENNRIQNAYQSLAHAVIRQAVEDENIDVDHFKKMLFRSKNASKKNPTVINNNKVLLKEMIEHKESAIDFMNNGIDLEKWIGIAFTCQIDQNKDEQDVIDLATKIREKSKNSLVVRPY